MIELERATARNKEFVRKHPVATKRAVRAILKADQICALEPERVARTMVDRGFTKSYDYALQTVKEVPYGRWRHQYDPEDTVRFYALRLHEAGAIKSSPAKIIAQGTDWRFLKELKGELKGSEGQACGGRVFQESGARPRLPLLRCRRSALARTGPGPGSEAKR